MSAHSAASQTIHELRRQLSATYASLALNLGMLHARGAAAPARIGNRHGGLGFSARVVNFAAVDELIESWTKTLAKDEVARRMLAAKVPCAAVRNLSEVMNDENMHARRSLQWIDHPELGRVVLPHSPLVFEGTERRPIEPSLPLGAGNDEVFGAWLGHSEAEVAAYKAEGVIGESQDDLVAKAEVI